MALSKVTLTGTFTDGRGTPVAGKVSFAPNTPLTSAADDDLIRQVQVSATLDVNGQFSVQLIATDYGSISPSGWAWVITESITGAPPRKWSFFLAHASGATQDLSALAPVAAVPPSASYLPVPAGTATSGYVPIATGTGEASAWGSPGAASLPLTTLGDLLYENATPTAARLAGNTAATKKFLTQTVTGTISAAPAWGTIAVGDVPSLSALGALPVAGGTMTGALAPAVVTLSQSSGSVAVNAALGNVFALTLTASGWTISNPSNPVDGQGIRIRLIQDGTGSRTVSWGSAYDFGGAGAPALTTVASKVDVVGFEYIASISKWCALGSALAF